MLLFSSVQPDLGANFLKAGPFFHCLSDGVDVLA